jgi:hypothetical protein
LGRREIEASHKCATQVAFLVTGDTLEFDAKWSPNLEALVAAVIVCRRLKLVLEELPEIVEPEV